MRTGAAQGFLRLPPRFATSPVVGIFPNEASIRRLVGAILMEQSEEVTVQRDRYMSLETLAPLCDDLSVSLSVA